MAVVTGANHVLGPARLNGDWFPTASPVYVAFGVKGEKPNSINSVAPALSIIYRPGELAFPDCSTMDVANRGALPPNARWVTLSKPGAP